MTLDAALLDEARALAPVAGVDEVGRGPLVGDVVTAAVILDPANPIEGLADSKKLSEKKRLALFDEIKAIEPQIQAGALQEGEALDRSQARIAELTRQVNAALGKSAPATKSAKPTAQAAEPSEGAPSDQPQTGAKYRVKPGDTVTKIALRNGSKVEWILKANNLSSPAALKADVDVFVPQAETPAR